MDQEISNENQGFELISKFLIFDSIFGNPLALKAFWKIEKLSSSESVVIQFWGEKVQGGWPHGTFWLEVEWQNLAS